MPDTFALLSKRQHASSLHALHGVVHKPLKVVSTCTYLAGACLEHWTVFGVAASVFLATHLITWVLAE